MGIDVSTLWDIITGKRKIKVCMIGLDNAGKSTILHQYKENRLIISPPTLRLVEETISYKDAVVTLCECGWEVSRRDMWRYGCENSNVLLFIVDASDRERIEEAMQMLHRALEQEVFIGVPLLVCANKQDAPLVMNQSEIIDCLKLQEIKQRVWYIIATSTAARTGLDQVLEWIYNNALQISS